MYKLLSILLLITYFPAIITQGKVSYHLSHFRSITQKPSVKFDSMWVTYNTWQAGVKGMLIHLKFTTYNMKGLDCEMAVYFEHDDEWPLEDKNNKYSSDEGDVAVFRKIKPAYTEALYNDLQIFMPYDELDLDPGKYELTMDVDLYYGKGRNSEHLTFYDFQFTQPGSSVKNTGKTSNINLENVWIEYDITENRLFGMRIHAKLAIDNMKGTSSYLAVFFSKRGGAKLTSDNKVFRSEAGQLALYKIIEPKYDESVYDDIRFFLPYAELKLPAAKHNLTLTVAFLDKDGNRIKTLKNYDFVFTKR